MIIHCIYIHACISGVFFTAIYIFQYRTEEYYCCSLFTVATLLLWCSLYCLFTVATVVVVFIIILACYFVSMYIIYAALIIAFFG